MTARQRTLALTIGALVVLVGFIGMHGLNPTDAATCPASPTSSMHTPMVVTPGPGPAGQVRAATAPVMASMSHACTPAPGPRQLTAIAFLVAVMGIVMAGAQRPGRSGRHIAGRHPPWEASRIALGVSLT